MDSKEEDVNTISDKMKQYQSKGVTRVKLGITDIDGVIRGKYVSLKKFESVLKSTGAFCDCVFGWDVNDVLYENDVKFTGWHTAFPDAKFKIDIKSERWLEEEGLPFFLGDFVDIDGKSEHPICPRNVLKRVLKRARGLGLDFNLAFEYEFFLFDETPHSVREKNYKNLKPLTPGMYGYSVLRTSTYSDLFNEFMDYCASLDIPIEGLHCETGPGVWEAAIEYDDALDAADKATLFKTFSKVFFQKREIMATFMARWSLDLPGQSGHIHISPKCIKTGKNLFFDDNEGHQMSELMQHFVAGMSKYMKQFLPLTTPTINSYTRLVKGFWAPTAATWGVENRTCALRAINGSENAQRVEYRVGAADSNPYLSAAAVIAAGLCGIEEKLKLSKPIVGNAYDVQDDLPKEMQLPSSLKESVANLKESKIAGKFFGEQFVEHFIKTREWEVSEYEKAITDWQLQRYFEII
ncbi:MAG: glutamine synthetase [Bacteriovoracaceae bacterium]|jgi:glutamine synthetase